ncbi:MAG: thioredoxin family protein [Deltaproteobacteria bacterium]|nr:thioredoxin family protein [Deltaproteobacteria bacterium]
MKRIEILGSGCSKCNQLESNARKAVAEAGVEAEVVHVVDLKKISEYKVLFTPAIAVDGVVKASGKISSVDEIKKWIV